MEKKPYNAPSLKTKHVRMHQMLATSQARSVSSNVYMNYNGSSSDEAARSGAHRGIWDNMSE